ncbi:MAG: hypothetical protein ACYCQJ_12340 [Nitrososphaerales archaeon]
METTLEPSLRKGYQGLYSGNVIVAPGLVVYLHEGVSEHHLQDPLFPLDDLLEVSIVGFPRLLRRAITEYQRPSSVYNVQRVPSTYGVCLKVLERINPHSELLVKKGIGWWLLELLRRLPEEYKADWVAVVDDLPSNMFHPGQYKILKRVIDDVKWQLHFSKHNSSLQNYLPKVYIEQSIPF